MNLKEVLINLKNLFIRKPNNNKSKTQILNPEITEEEEKLLEQVKEFHEEDILEEENQPIEPDLDHKVDEFIDWYTENMVKGRTSIYGEYYSPIKLREFIEKMAVWYELRYPNYEINRLMHCSGQEKTKVSEEMFVKNPYIKDFIGDSQEVKYLDWDEFYNAKAFIRSLPWQEQYYLKRPKYTRLIYLDELENIHLHLSYNGTVMVAEEFCPFTEYEIYDSQLVGMHIKDVLALLKEKGIILEENNEIERAIARYEKEKYFKEELLNCVMYRIIERGGDRIGPRRGFLFAKEFKRNIDIPMMYGVEYTDVGLRSFINEYLQAGGSQDLECYIAYFSKKADKEPLKRIKIEDILKFKMADAQNKYTEEETKYHQRIVNVLAGQINEEELRKAKIDQSRLVRRLEKSRRR